MKFTIESNGITVSGTTTESYTLLGLVNVLAESKAIVSAAASPVAAATTVDLDGILEAYDGRPDASHKIVAFGQPVVGQYFLDPSSFTVKKKTTPAEFGPRLIVEAV